MALDELVREIVPVMQITTATTVVYGLQIAALTLSIGLAAYTIINVPLDLAGIRYRKIMVSHMSISSGELNIARASRLALLIFPGRISSKAQMDSLLTDHPLKQELQEYLNSPDSVGSGAALNHLLTQPAVVEHLTRPPSFTERFLGLPSYSR